MTSSWFIWYDKYAHFLCIDVGVMFRTILNHNHSWINSFLDNHLHIWYVSVCVWDRFLQMHPITVCGSLNPLLPRVNYLPRPVFEIKIWCDYGLTICVQAYFLFLLAYTYTHCTGTEMNFTNIHSVTSICSVLLYRFLKLRVPFSSPLSLFISL